MKMATEMRDEWASAIAPHDTEEMRELYRTGQFSRSELTKDVDKRYRWDLAWHALGSRRICDSYELGLNDVHIDTALRSIIAPLGMKGN